MTFSMTRFARLAVASALSAALAVGPALADGPSRRGSIKDPVAPPAPRACALSANVALATEYVFRGISQTDEGPAIQGGFDATCGILLCRRVGFQSRFRRGRCWQDIANIEIDFYAGIKPKTGRITWDLGVIYYAYPERQRCGCRTEHRRVQGRRQRGSLEGRYAWRDGVLLA